MLPAWMTTAKLAAADKRVPGSLQLLYQVICYVLGIGF